MDYCESKSRRPSGLGFLLETMLLAATFYPRDCGSRGEGRTEKKSRRTALYLVRPKLPARSFEDGGN